MTMRYNTKIMAVTRSKLEIISLEDAKRYMGLAIEDAYLGIKNGDGGPFGATFVRVSDGEILATTHNTVLKNNDSTEHAEMNGIRMTAKKLGNWDLSGTIAFSTTEPCPMCFSALHWARVDVVYYGTSIEDVKRIGFNELSIPNIDMKNLGKSNLVIVRDFMLEECLALLDYYKKNCMDAVRY
ncbi:nucleoside deaminase [Candidatus Margulisiibacteriota bacterium]